MCIIAAKPAGIPMPSPETIRTMWEHNHDGAGLMYVAKGKVRIEKGFMTLGALQTKLGELEKSMDLVKTPVVLHFRIQTHGGVCPECTHPFPITDSIGALKKLSVSTDLGVAHNGIITSVNPRKGISDTMEYIATQLAPLKRALPRFYKNKDARLLIQNAIESRMAFLTADGKIYTVGDFIEDEGILFSNESYIPWSVRSSSWNCYGGWDSDDDDCDVWGALDAEHLENTDLPTKTLAWLNDGEYVTVNGEMFDDDCFLIDEEGNVWDYDFGGDCAYRVPEAQAFTAEGVPARYELEEYADLVPIWDP